MIHLFDHRELTPTPNGLTGLCTAGYGTRIFGGHSLSQSLIAASASISYSRGASSLHSVFLAPGLAAAPVHYAATPLKRGRAFDVVRVCASQNDREILETLVSFHDGEPGLEFQVTPPEVIPAVSLEDDPLHRYSTSDARAPFICRTVPHDSSKPHMQTWIRTVDELTDDPLQHQAALTYALDFLITKTAHNPIDTEKMQHRGASLDHTMWFHRPFRADEWLLVDVVTTSFFSSRSMSQASIFDASGSLVSSASQEALLRPPVSDLGSSDSASH